MATNEKRSHAALDGKKFDCFYMDPEELILVTNKKHPLYDERVDLPLDELMVKNVLVNGVNQTIEIVKEVIGDVPPTDGLERGSTALVVITGRQRVKWARAANAQLAAADKELINVPVVLRRGLSDADLYGRVITENEIRIADTPMGRARKLKQYLALGRSEEQATIEFGCSLQSVHNWMALLDLAPEVQRAVDCGQVAAHSVAPLAKLPREDQVTKLKELQAAGGTVTRQRTTGAVHGKKSVRPKKVLVRRMVAALEESNSSSAKAAAAFYNWAMGTAPKTSVINLGKAFEEADARVAAEMAEKSK